MSLIYLYLNVSIINKYCFLFTVSILFYSCQNLVTDDIHGDIMLNI